jgi:hypothetical protein
MGNTHNSRSLGRKAWTPCACSLQHRELMARDDEFQQEVNTLAERASALQKAVD